MRTQKLLAALLSSAMVLGTMAVPVLADGNEAKIGTTEYATLVEAVANVKSGETITLLKDASGAGIGIFENTATELASFTIDFGGYTYTIDSNLVGSSGYESQAFHLEKGNFNGENRKVTLKNGTIKSTNAKMLVQNYSDLTLEGMTLTLDNPNYASAYTLSNNNGEVAIKDTTINANPAGGFAFDVCRYASYPSVHVTVTGNSQINGNVEVSASGGDAKDGFSLDFGEGKLNGFVVIDPSAKKAMEDSYSYVSTAGATSNVSEADFAAAVESAANGATITLCGDVALTKAVEITKDLTIDLQTYGIIATDARALWVKSGNVTIKGDNGYVQTESTNLADKDFSGTSVIRVGDKDDNAKAAKLTIEDPVWVKSNHCYGVSVFGKNSDIEFVLNGTVDAAGDSPAISGNGSKGLSATKMTINGKVYGNVANEDYAIYHPGKGTLTINDGATVSGYGGIEAKAGTVTVNGGTIEADAEAQGHAASNNGTSTSGYAIAAVNNKNYAGEPAITVKNGNITGEVAIIDDDEDATNNTAKISITGGTFTSDPQAYVAQGYAAASSASNYEVKAIAKLNTTEFTNVLARAASGKPVTIKSAVKSGKYEQVTAKTTQGDNATFTITATGDASYNGGSFNLINIADRLRGANYSGEIVCGLVITDIPSGVTLTIK